jgi:hypothetical protein
MEYLSGKYLIYIQGIIGTLDTSYIPVIYRLYTSYILIILKSSQNYLVDIK